MIEITAEPPRPDQLFEVLIRCRHHSYVHGNFLAASEPVIRNAIEHAQEFYLNFGIKVADLIQKKRPFIRQFEKSRLHCVRAAERALLVAEKLAFNQVLRDGGTIHVNPWSIATKRMGVNGASNHLLARSGFTYDQDSRRMTRHLFHQLQHSLECIAAGHKTAGSPRAVR